MDVIDFKNFLVIIIEAPISIQNGNKKEFLVMHFSSNLKLRNSYCSLIISVRLDPQLILSMCAISFSIVHTLSII